jgi:ribose 1,5-bisphosphate isomerase
VNPQVEEILKEISGNRRDGATTIAMRGLDALEIHAGSLSEDPGQAEIQVADLVYRIDALRPSLGSVGVQAVLAFIRTTGLVAKGLSWSSALASAVAEERKTSGLANGMIAMLTAKEIETEKVLVSCSWSTSALSSIVGLKPRLVRLGEGCHLRDGLRAAQWLCARGIKVELVPDGALPTAVEGADAVLIGADQVLDDGSIVNRTGSFSLALSANHFGIPFYVVCQRIKLGGAKSIEIEQLEEFAQDLPQGVNGYAPLFDITPSTLVHRVITEAGRLTSQEASETGRAIRELRRQVLMVHGSSCR